MLQSFEAYNQINAIIWTRDRGTFPHSECKIRSLIFKISMLDGINRNVDTDYLSRVAREKVAPIALAASYIKNYLILCELGCTQVAMQVFNDNIPGDFR